MPCYDTYSAMWLVGGVALLSIVTGIVGAILAHKAGMTR
jgi:hypothetical protein